jgi:hypothetical protein
VDEKVKDYQDKLAAANTANGDLASSAAALKNFIDATTTAALPAANVKPSGS